MVRLFVLGDLTHYKDEHSARLVNRLTNEIESLSHRVQIFILKGNHDYVDPACPFFHFLRFIPNVVYINETEYLEVEGKRVLAVPHQPNWLATWEPLRMEREEADFVLLHQCFEGAKNEQGMAMEGPTPETFKHCKTGCVVLAGDIHTPQRLGQLIYVGAPHPINFGDDYLNRVLWYGQDGLKQVIYPAIRKLRLDVSDLKTLEAFKFENGDQVKIVAELGREEFATWPQTRDAMLALCAQAAVRVGGIELTEKKVDPKQVRKATERMSSKPVDVVRLFADHHDVDDETLEVGIHLVT